MSTMYHYWGKATSSDQERDRFCHLLPYHGLDVAATGLAWLRHHRHFIRYWAIVLHVTEGELEQWVSALLALHDLGKFTHSFQNQRPDLLLKLQGITSRHGYSTRHDTLGWWLWLEEMTEPNSAILDLWLQAVMGHHGQPPQEPDNVKFYLLGAVTDGDRQAIRAYRQAIALLLPTPSLPILSREHRPVWHRFSWWIAGLTVLADWLGSNRQWFPFRDRAIPLTEYWPLAQSQAEEAVRQAGLVYSVAAPAVSFAQLFPHLSGQDPSPLQQLVSTLSLGEGARLFIVEDVTGAGKTEAAILLIQRLLVAGASDGFYVALPTLATADAMYQRVGELFNRLFQGQESSLVLAHGQRALSESFRRVWLGPNRENVDTLPGEEIAAGWHCRAWLADHTKKALLAQGGVGTIDQALMAVLTIRHQSLRLLGLFGKVLVVDEVHANDAYMHAILKKLLEFHAQAGGNVILLSATLPCAMRQELVAAFQQGAGYNHPPHLQPADAYPLLTRIDAQAVAAISVATRPNCQRNVAVIRIDRMEILIQQFVEKAAAGACVGWVRNTVADAREGYRLLAERWSVERLILFHARFAMGDRLAIEQRVVTNLGRDSTPEQRRGCIVIATQVIEQSLDLDFDWLATDLAPIDLVIQRAGRLRRHRRRADGTLLDHGSDQRGPPILWWFAPDPVDQADSKWVAALLPGTAAVYSDHGKLWQTARMVQRLGGFTLPEQARRLIEGVYGTVEEPLPAGLCASTDRAMGERHAMVAQARFNTLELDKGYAATPHLWSDEGLVPTRLGDPVCTIRLLRWQDGRVALWHTTGSDPRSASEVRIRQIYAAKSDETAWGADLAVAVAECRQQWPDQGRWVVVLPLTPMDAGWWQGTVLDGKGQRTVMFYHLHWGLVREAERFAIT